MGFLFIVVFACQPRTRVGWWDEHGLSPMCLPVFVCIQTGQKRKGTQRPNAARMQKSSGFFIFLFFNFIFTKIYFRFRNLQIYTPAAPLPGGRGFYAKSFIKNLHAGPWRTGRPAARRPAPQAARQLGGRPWAFRARAIQLSRARRQRRPIDRRSEAWTTPLLLGGRSEIWCRCDRLHWTLLSPVNR